MNFLDRFGLVMGGLLLLAMFTLFAWMAHRTGRIPPEGDPPIPYHTDPDAFRRRDN